MIYQIAKDGKSAPEPLQTSTLQEQGWNEKDLENYLSEHIAEFVGPDLFVIEQSKPWQPDVDLLALDSSGDLWFFELKAVRSDPGNLLQVLRYSQAYSRLSIDELSARYEQFSNDRTRSLAVAFCKYFGYSSPSAVEEWGARIGKKHRLLVVTDGADDDTILAVNHWQRHGVDIDIWPYRVHAGDNKVFTLEVPELFVAGRRISGMKPSVYLVNTNRSYEPNAEPHMLQHGVALATAEAWMRKINRICAGSRVLLYANRAGIVGLGVATPDRRDGLLDGTPMRFVKLRDFKRLSTPMSPADIKKAAGSRIVFRHTVAELSDKVGDSVWEAALAST